MSGCLTDEELEHLARASEPGASDATRREHLAACGRCRARLRDEARQAELLAELRSSVRPRRDELDVPGYRLLEAPFRGGQGLVWRAVQEATGRIVALKRMRPGDLRTARARRRFEREIDLASRLAHPGIVAVLDSGRTDGLPWFAMEWVDGATLDVHLAHTDPPQAERLRLFRELCAAVAHAHRAGVLHRDLKPENVLVDAAGHVRVLDFGTALGLEGLARERVTAPDEFLGTLAYAAPEQIAPGSHGRRTPDTRTDVWALGVLLYELTTGHLPFDGPPERDSNAPDGLARRVEQVLEEAPTPPGHWVRGFDRDLAAILARALAKDPERRYPSVEALVRDLDHLAAHEPLETQPRTLLRSLKKAVRRHRRGLVAATLALGLGTVLVTAALRERWRAERARADAALVRAVVTDLASSRGPMGTETRLLEALALAAREIEGNLTDAPDAQAALELTLGDTYRRLHLSREAEPHLRAALERLRSGGADLEIARALDLLGLVLADRNQPEAIALQEEALALRTAALSADDPRVAESERGLALALLAPFQGSDRARAAALLERSMARFTRALGPDDPEVAQTGVILARLRPGQGAEALYEHALAVLAPDDARRIDALTDFAGRLQATGRLERAQALLEEAARQTERLYGAELGLEMLHRLASVRLERGDAAGAEELVRRAIVLELEGWARRQPDESDSIRTVVAGLETRRAPLEPPYAEAYALLRRFRGAGAFELARESNRLAGILRALGRAAAGEPLLREALNVRCRAWGGQCPIRADTLERLAGLLVEQERPAEAEPLLAEGLRIASAHEDESAQQRFTALLSACRADPPETD